MTNVADATITTIATMIDATTDATVNATITTTVTIATTVTKIATVNTTIATTDPIIATTLSYTPSNYSTLFAANTTIVSAFFLILYTTASFSTFTARLISPLSISVFIFIDTIMSIVILFLRVRPTLSYPKSTSYSHAFNAFTSWCWTSNNIPTPSSSPSPLTPYFNSPS